MSSLRQTASPPKAVRGMGPAIIVVLIILAALLGYYQIVYYPAVATTATSSTSVTPRTPHLTNITILAGAPTAPRALTFSPDIATVYIGFNSTVVWTNADSAEHTVTANATVQNVYPAFYSWSEPPGGFNNIFPKGATGDAFNFTFTVAGTYGYYCKYHPNMIGTIIVKAALANLTGTTSGSGATSSGVTSTTSAILGGVSISYFVSEATVFARSLATLTGSGTAP